MRNVIAAVLSATLMLAAAPPAAAAQDMQWTTVTRVELGGSLGRIMRIMPGMGDPVRETVSYAGSLRRTDDGGAETSTIMSADDASILLLNHEMKTYWRMSLDEMMGALRGAGADMEAAMDSARAEAEAAREDDRNPVPQQVVIMRTTSEIGDVRTGALSPDLFVAPAGYTQQAGLPGAER